MRKIPTNSRPSPAKTELPLDLAGPHVTAGLSAAHRLYQALCEMIVSGLVKPGERPFIVKGLPGDGNARKP